MIHASNFVDFVLDLVFVIIKTVFWSLLGLRMTKLVESSVGIVSRSPFY